MVAIDTAIYYKAKAQSTKKFNSRHHVPSKQEGLRTRLANYAQQMLENKKHFSELISENMFNSLRLRFDTEGQKRVDSINKTGSFRVNPNLPFKASNICRKQSLIIKYFPKTAEVMIVTVSRKRTRSGLYQLRTVYEILPETQIITKNKFGIAEHFGKNSKSQVQSTVRNQTGKRNRDFDESFTSHTVKRVKC